jgi:tripartite ATP-independent transporter DctP family solute receptor
MMTTRWALGLAIIALALAFVVCPGTLPSAAGQDKVVIRLGSPFKAGHILVDAAEKFKELVAQGSGGRIEVQFDLGTKSEEEINKLNSTGALDMQSNGTMYIEKYAPAYYFVSVPYIMKDWDHYMRVWDGKLGQQAQAQMEKNGNLKFLGSINRGVRQTTAKRPIYTPADVYGLKLRLPVLPTWVAIWKAIGADPVPLPLTELYGGLKSGKADASEGDVSQITSFKLDEVQTHLIMTNHMVTIGGLVIHKPFFDKLSKSDQTLVTLGAKEACDFANAKMKATESSYVLELQRKGMQVVIPDAESFRVKAKPAVDELFQKEWSVTNWGEVLAQ